MQYDFLKPFRISKQIIIPQQLKNGKNVCFAFFSENDTFINASNFIPIRKQTLKHVFVPTIMTPFKAFMDSKYKKELVDRKYIAIKARLGEYNKLHSRNFIFDVATYTTAMVNKFGFKRFDYGRAYYFFNNMMNMIKTVPDSEYEKVLFYSINLNNDIPPKLRLKKAYPILLMIREAIKTNSISTLPFDRLILHFYNNSGSRCMLLFDKKIKVNFSKMVSIFKKLNKLDDDTEDKENGIVNNIVQNSVDDSEENVDPIEAKVNNSIKTYLDANPEDKKDVVKSVVRDKEESGDTFSNKDLALTSVLYHKIGDPDKAKEVAQEIKKNGLNNVNNAIIANSATILPKSKAQNYSRDFLIKESKVEKLVDNQVPTHLLEKRQSDFGPVFYKDIKNAFSVLEKKDFSLKTESINMKTIKSPSSELKPTIKDRYNIVLVDKENNKHDISIDIPHLTPNGSFIINGQEKVLVNQIITYPIFFFKPYIGKFISSYSSIDIISKRLSKTSYLLGVFGSSYKFPLIMLLSYKIGFEKTLQDYNISYSISEEQPDKSNYFIKLPNEKYATFEWQDERGKELVESLKFSIPYFDKNNFDLLSSDTWRQGLESYIGSRNCIYLLDQIWDNVVTPIEIEILSSRSDPTELKDIIKYIAGEVVKGRVDDRNDINIQRIRSSEIIVALLQKQIYAAYNEYEAKKHAGDPNARLYINSTKAFSEIVVSQNLQTFEDINPLEELSVLTRITPIGIGGLPDKEAYPISAMTTHPSYYGNVDPLETPAGPGIGAQQQLTVGASVTDVRGTFAIKDRKDIKSTEILSTGPALIPFVESNDGCRVVQAAGQSKQAVPLKNSETPAIQTGYETVLTPLLSSNFIKKSPVDGTVIEITDFLIVIRDRLGKKHFVDIKPVTLKSGQGKNGLSRFIPLVKEFNKVKTGQIIAEGSNIKDGMIANGINILCAFMPWKGFNFEDGMVISESAAKKFTSLHVEEEFIYLKEEEEVGYVVEKGIMLNKGDILITYSSSLYDVESHKHLRTDGGIVVNIEVYSNIEEDKIPEALKPHYLETRKTHEALRGRYTIGSFQEKGKHFEGILVRFTVQQELSLIKGDKLNNRHYNKGVVAIVEKDENMPVTPWGERLEMIYSPLSVINRMNTGQLCELHTSLISKRLANIMRDKSKKEFIETFTKVMNILSNEKNSKFMKSMISTVKQWSDKKYKEYRERIIKIGFLPLVFAPFKSPDRDQILKALKFLNLKSRYSLFLPEYNKKVDPVSVGWIFVSKLEHMSEKKIHARGIGPYVSRTMSPTGGKRSFGGQTLGEYDMYSLLAWGAPTLIDEFFGPMSTDHITKNEMISEIIQKGETSYRVPKSIPSREIFANMMLAIHLTSE